MIKRILIYALVISVDCIGIYAGLIEGLTTAAVDTVTIPERVVEGRPLRGPRPYYREGYYAPADPTTDADRLAVQRRRLIARREPYTNAPGQLGQGYYTDQPKSMMGTSMMGTELEQQYKQTNPISSTEQRAQQRSAAYGRVQ